jgi:hypothetical protein
LGEVERSADCGHTEEAEELSGRVLWYGDDVIEEKDFYPGGAKEFQVWL